MQTRPAKRERNQRGRGDRLRSEVIDAAMRILDQNLLNELSLRMVAREVGVAATSVNTHFPDAKTMVTEVGRECWRQLGEAMADSTARLVHPTAFEELTAKMRAYVQYAMERPSRYQLLFAPEYASSESSPNAPGLLQPAYRSVIAPIEHLAAEGRTIPAKDAISTTLLILSVAHGRIASAHLAPWRAGNSAAGVTAFVVETLSQLFGADKKRARRPYLQAKRI
ncbi:TetR/AcrR family transcriptional regulator [Acidocella aquatica]|uniref:TetR/AcrR family transcriptional regulator n=1 Tax=Acidocella aquatica TaxID=1922313 RepID=UPI0024E11A7B|nr:TetR/AcrR family transcriptional regulator [Acidocella aquatica]